MPKTDAERQAARRKRLKEKGMEEVRGIYLPHDLHAKLKAHATKLKTQRKERDK